MIPEFWYGALALGIATGSFIAYLFIRSKKTLLFWLSVAAVIGLMELID